MTPLSKRVSPKLCICRDPKCKIPYGKCHCGCDRDTKIAKYSSDYGTYWTVAGLPLKFIHGHQMRKSFLRPRPRPFMLRGKLRCWIPLTRGMRALIDYADLDIVWKYAWTAHKGARGNWYARTYVRLADGKVSYPLMHRLIMGVTDPDIEVDHIDGDATLNNTRDNLQAADHGQQQCKAERPRGKSGYRGVVPAHNKSGSFTSYVDYHGVRYQCGSFKLVIDAARARDRLALKLQGKFATLNFPRTDYPDVAV